MRDYCDAILDVARECGCNPVDIAGYGLDYESLEGTHPTALGMAQLADLVIAGMEGRPEPAMRNFGPQGNTAGTGPIDWRSKELCPGRACVGCPWAKGTGNAWYTVCEKPDCDR